MAKVEREKERDSSILVEDVITTVRGEMQARGARLGEEMQRKNWQ